MTNRTKTYVVALGLLAGTLAIAPAARAQISVTGGNTTGQAAFFVPTLTPQGNVRLFDTQINTLRLETPNGITTTSIFTPSAASFSDTNSSGTPNAGDTGTLQGTLAGVAFAANGTPVVFSGRPTALNFTLNSFNSNIGTIDGTLIRSETPGAAPLVFLPGVDSEALTLQTPGFVDDGGQLQLGDFAAAINTGVIGLPSTFQFLESGSGGGTTPPPTDTLLRRIRFDFRGENVLAGAGTDLDATDGTLRYVGPVTERFRIQSVGTRRNSEFKIDGDFGALDLSLNGPIEVEQNGVVDPLQPIDRYRIRGEAEGVFAFYGPTTYGFNGVANRDTRFQFEQETGSLDGRSDGSVNFFAAAGLETVDTNNDGFDDFEGFDFSSDSFTIIDNSSISFNFSCNLCGTNLVIGSPIVVGGTPIVVGSPIVVPVQPNQPSGGQGGQGGQGGSSAGGTTVINTYINVSSVNSDLFTLVGSSDTALFQYGYVTGYRYLVLGQGLRRGQVFVRVVELNGDRYYLVTEGHGGHGRGRGRGRGLARGRQSILVAYNQVGPGSRIFPGLVGLREISAADLEELNLDDDTVGFEDTTDETTDDASDDTSVDTTETTTETTTEETTDETTEATTDETTEATTDDVSDDTSVDTTDDATNGTTDNGSSTGVTVIQGLDQL
ncbi:MAG TPA: hypothetical protein V6C88_17175 [Chroococcidiopsis sp.]